MNMAKRYVSFVSMGLLLLLAGCSQSISERSADKSPQDSTSSPTDIAPAETVPDSQEDAIDREVEKESAEKEPDFTVNVRLVDGTIELSTSELETGRIDFNVLNEDAEPLNIQVIKTEIAPDKVLVKTGQVDRTQPGVEVISQVRDRPINPNTQALISETLLPGEYKVVVTSNSQTKPIAHTTITISHEV